MAAVLKRRPVLTFRTPSRGYSSLRGALGGGGALLGSERGGPRGRCGIVSEGSRNGHGEEAPYRTRTLRYDLVQAAIHRGLSVGFAMSLEELGWIAKLIFRGAIEM